MAVGAMAELNGDGYYRVQNALTKRYAYLMDNRGSFDPQTTSADVQALHLYSGFVRASSDPASVFYLNNVNGSSYNIAGQGTSLYGFLGEYLKIIKGKSIDGIQSYYAYASKSGFTKYLGDIRSDLSSERGNPSVDAKGDDRLWYIDAISNTGDNNYFGIAPTLTAGGKYYYPFYAGFPFAAYSSDMNFYVVSRIEPEFGVVVISRLSGNVPASTPVIVECANPLATDNRLTIGPSGSNASVPSNYLRGVYFDNDMKTHYNRTPYDKNTMRSLAVENGKLVFSKGDYEFCPRNQAYLLLPNAAACAVDTYQIMTDSEFDAYVDELTKLNPDGYYRMQNTQTKRYAYLLDNTGSQTDVNAIQMYSDLVKANSDPASVLYMSKPANGGIYDRTIAAQGTSSQTIFGKTLTIKPSEVVDGLQSFTVNNGGGFLGDKVSYAGHGQTTLGDQGENTNWWFKSMSTDSDNYFGIAPTVTAGGKYYHPFMAGFPVSGSSAGIKFYIVTKINAELEVMVLKAVDGVIPAGTPVIVECENPLASDNRLVVGAQGTPADVSGNQLKAVYYDITDVGHANHTAYDAKTMRSLTSVDGKLMFAPGNMQYVPRNEAYIALATEGQKAIGNYNVLTEEEYDSYVESLKDMMPDGFYRMQNVATGRSVILVDNKASVSASDDSDLGAFRLSGDFDKNVSDPASVFSFASRSTSTEVPFWVVSSQNTSVAGTLGTNIRLLPAGESDGKPVFDAYIIVNGVKVHLADSGSMSDEDATLTSNTTGKNSKWWLNSVEDESTDNYFGVTPSIEVNGKYYCPFIADFPFEPASEGVKTYVIDRVDVAHKQIIRKEVKGTIIAQMPVILECESPAASDNRLRVGIGQSIASIAYNRLKGVWFDNTEDGHVNFTARDDSMRSLVSKDGKLMFVKSDEDVLPRNQAYMLLSGDRELAIDEYEVLTEDEYTGTHGVNVIPEDGMVDVYHIDGTLVKTSVLKSEVNELPAGLYLLKCGETCEKYLVN